MQRVKKAVVILRDYFRGDVEIKDPDPNRARTRSVTRRERDAENMPRKRATSGSDMKPDIEPESSSSGKDTPVDGQVSDKGGASHGHQFPPEKRRKQSPTASNDEISQPESKLKNRSKSVERGSTGRDQLRQTASKTNRNVPRAKKSMSRAVSLLDFVTAMPEFNPVVEVFRVSDKTVQLLTEFREYHSSDYGLSTSEDNFTPPNSDGEHITNDESNDSTDISLSSDDEFETNGRQFCQSRASNHGPDLPLINATKKRVLASSLSGNSGTDRERTIEPSEGTEDTVVIPSNDSGLTPSATTVFDSGRSDDSGASTSRKLQDHLTQLDNMIAEASADTLHGPSCVCLKCIRILNVDGNDSPELSTEEEEEEASAVFLSSRQRGKAQDEARPKAPLDGNSSDSIDESTIDTQLPVRSAPANMESGLGFDPEPGCSGAPAKQGNTSRKANDVRPWHFKESKVQKSQRQAIKSLEIAMNSSDDSDGEESTNSIAAILRRIDERIPSVVQAAAREEARVSDNVDDLSSDSDVEPSPRFRLPRVRRSWDSDSETTTDCDETDYSDEDDVRNFFVNMGVEDLEMAKTNPITGHEQRNRRARGPNDTIDLDSSREERQEMYEQELRDEWRPFLWVDSAPAEKLPANLEELVHFPNEDILAEDPQVIFERLLVLGASHHVPIVFLDKVWRLCQMIYEFFTGEKPKGFYSLRQKVLDDLPGCTLHYTLQHRRTKAVTHVRGKAFRRKRYPARKYAPLISETRANLQDLMDYHAKLHDGTDRGERLSQAVKEKLEIPVSFYVDGVSPSTTGSMKMICEVVRHSCCNLILCYNTVLYAKDYEITPDDLLQGLLSDLSRYPHIKVELVICDLPERLRLCGHTHFNGLHGCLHCLAKGESRQVGPGVVWPPSTMGQPLRDDQSFRELAEKTQELGCPVGGTKSKSPLLSIPNFSIVDCVAIEPMHLFAGLSRFFWEKLAKRYFPKQQMSDLTKDISEAYCALSFPSDFKRDRRSMDPPKWRCNEWKQFVAILGIDVGDYYYNKGHRDAAALWYRYTWILRMVAQGDVWYKHGTRRGRGLRDQIAILYRQVEDILGKDKCIPNLHALYHLPDWRDKQPLGRISAEKAEAFYGVVRRSFAEQGASIGKQIHVNTLIAAKRGHVCETRFKFKPKLQPHDMDHLMVDNERRVHRFMGESNDGEHYQVRKVHCIPYNDNEGLFNWRDCGVMRVVAESKVETQIPAKTVIARAIVAKDRKLFVWTRDLHDF